MRQTPTGLSLSATDLSNSLVCRQLTGLDMAVVCRRRWSIWVNGNWRLTFEFRDGHVHDLDYEDYH